MRIIQVSPEFPPNCGGIGHYVAYLSEELIKRGHEVSVIFRGKYERTYNYKNIPIIEFKVPCAPPINTNFLKRRIENLLADKEFDLVNVHYGAMPAIFCRKPVIVTAHWCVSEGTSAFYRPIRSMDSFYRNIMLPFYRNIERKTASKCQKLTVVSESLKKEYYAHHGVNADVVYNGVDTRLFNDKNKIEKEEAILFTGRLCIGKGALDLIRIAKLLVKSHKNLNIYMIGDGPLRKTIMSKLKNESLHNIKMFSSLTHSKLIKYYQKSIIYVLPSYYEGLPTTILEAMACNLPVVATNVSGIPELIDHGKNGFMLSPGDTEGFYKRIIELLEDKEKRTKFGEMGRRKVLDKFTWQLVASIFEEKYRAVLKLR